MKNQYVGDVNDYYKYGLIRHFSKNSKIRTAVCWMLTKNDGTKQGKNRGYRNNPNWAYFDEGLYNKLNIFEDKSRRDVREVERRQSNILENCEFNSKVIGNIDNADKYYYLEQKKRSDYFNNFIGISSDCQLLFFDPDTGIQVNKMTKPHEEYLFWDEINQMYKTEKALMIFRYSRMDLTSEKNLYKFIMQSTPYIDNAINGDQNGKRQKIRRIYTFASPHVLFMLVTQPPYNGDIDICAIEFWQTRWHQYGHPKKGGDLKIYGMVMNIVCYNKTHTKIYYYDGTEMRDSEDKHQ